MVQRRHVLWSISRIRSPTVAKGHKIIHLSLSVVFADRYGGEGALCFKMFSHAENNTENTISVDLEDLEFRRMPCDPEKC